MTTGSLVNRVVLRTHGTVLILATTMLTAGGWIGYTTGEGQFGMLRREPIGYIGLFQAYLLMTTLGVALWIGSFSDRPRVWHLVGLLAHTPPLAANFLFWDDLDRYGITHAGVAVHLLMMVLELGAWAASRPRVSVNAPAIGNAT